MRASVLGYCSLVIASFFGVGYAPKAPGTMGTLAALPFAWLLYPRLDTAQKLLLMLLLTALAMVTAQVAGRIYREPDSGKIVIDEVVGFFAVALFMPAARPWCWALAFVLFRLFDIFKPWPASYFDRVHKNGFGVVMDDLAAGLLSLGVFKILFGVMGL